MRAVGVSPMSATLTSDASGFLGCGAFYGPQWFMLQWSESYLACHISAKELVPIVIAAVIWGKDWGGKTIRVWCDNTAAVSAVNLGTSLNQEAMHLVQCLASIKAKLKFDLVATHLPGVSNCRADALSRNHLSLFRTLRPQANQEPTTIPFFRFSDGKPLTRSRLVAKLKESIQAAGVNCAAYSGHSFRSGAATTAARQGIGDATIKMLGRWKSSAYQLLQYIKTPREQLAAVS